MSLLFETIGAVLQINDDYTVINSLVPGGQAAKRKAITVGDWVVSVGEIGKLMVYVIAWRLNDVVSLIKGLKGSNVWLEILPIGESTKTRIVTVTRDRIRLEDRETKISVKRSVKKK